MRGRNECLCVCVMELFFGYFAFRNFDVDLHIYSRMLFFIYVSEYFVIWFFFHIFPIRLK